MDDRVNFKTGWFELYFWFIHFWLFFSVQKNVLVHFIYFASVAPTPMKSKQGVLCFFKSSELQHPPPPLNSQQRRGGGTSNDPSSNWHDTGTVVRSGRCIAAVLLRL